jgi:hypothetical protein
MVTLLFCKVAIDVYATQQKQLQNENAVQYELTTKQGYKRLYLPEKITSNTKNAKILRLLEEVSEQQGVGVVKRVTSFGWKSVNHKLNFGENVSNFSFFISKQHTPNELFTRFGVKPEPLANDKLLVSGKQLPKAFQDNKFMLSSLSSSQSAKQREATYFINTSSDASAKNFYRGFATAYNKKFKLNFDVTDFNSTNIREAKEALYIEPLLLNEISEYLVMVIVILSFIYALVLSRMLGIYQLNGWSTFDIAKLQFKAGISAGIISYLCFVIFSSCTLGWYIEISQIVTGVLMFFGLFMVNLCMLLLVQKCFQIKSQLNSKNYAHFLFYALYGLKGCVFIIFITSLMPVVLYVNAQYGSLTHKPLKDNYLVAYPRINGNNTLESEDLNYTCRDITDSMYAYLSKRGAFNFNDDAIEKPEIAVAPLTKNNIEVDYLYLQHFPIYDVKGKRIVIKADETRFVKIVPDNYKFSKKYILNDYKRVTTKKSSGLKIIYYPHKQRIPNVIHDAALKSVTLDVITPANTEFVWNMMNGSGEWDSLKIPRTMLQKHNYKDYFEQLHRNNLADNYPQLITYNQLPDIDIALAVGNIKTTLIPIVVAMVVFILLVQQVTLLFYKNNMRRIKIVRIHGYSIFQTYSKLFSLWGISTVIALLLVTRLETSGGEYYLGTLILSILELVILVANLILLEKTSMRGEIT